MDRRDLFKAIAGVAAGAGVVSKVQIAEASERTVPALAIIEYPGIMSREKAERIRCELEHCLSGTPFNGMPALVLTDGMKLTLLDAQGRVLNRDISADDEV